MSDEAPVLVACVDFEAGSQEFIRTAIQFGDSIIVLCVVPEGSEHDQDEVARQVYALLPELDPNLIAGIEIRRGDPEDQILGYAREHQDIALALGRRSRGTIDRTYVSSTTSEVAAMAPCPVLVVPINPKTSHAEGTET